MNSETFSPIRKGGISKKFKRKTWKDKIKNLLKDDLEGFIESGDEVEVITKRPMTLKEEEDIRKILERTENG